MVHHSQYGDGAANLSRPSFSKAHSQSFTAGSNPNSAPMPNFSTHQRRRQSQPAAPSRSYTPQPEPTFDLMSSAQPMFGDVNFQMPNLSFDLSGSMSIPPATSSYTTSGLPASTFPDNSSFDSSAEPYLAHGLPEYDSNLFSTTELGPISGSDKSFSRPPLAPTASKLNSPFTSNGPILPPPASSGQGSTTDSMHKNQPQTPRKIVKAKSAAAARNQPLLPAPAGLRTPLAQRDPNAHGLKRAVPDSPTTDHASPRKAAKRSKTDEPGRHREMMPIPDAEAFPAIDAGDDSGKPPYTYAQMIALAIWKAPNRRRTLSQIYDFIRTTWCYYRKDDTWENSIRHNLSLHKKFFEKQARAKDDPGKGNYWLIIPGNERELLDVYLKERTGHDISMPGKSMAVISTARLEPSALPPPTSQQFQEPMLPPQIPHFQLEFPPVLQPPAPMQPEPSSDATISASEQAFDETDLADGPQNLVNCLDTTLTSSPPAIIRRASVPNGTPTRVARIGGSSGRTSSKRKRYSMVDSGYMTGLDSSIVRYGQQRAPVFSSEADSEFQGGGRAEDAIRKMRASSNESPSKGRTLMLPPSSPLGKSPLRYRASPMKASGAAKTPANSKKALAGVPSLPPPKTTSKYNNSPIRQHDKLRANVRSMLETPQCIRDYSKKYPGRRPIRGADLDSFAIFEDTTSGPEMESPLPANSAGRMLDELMSAKKNNKTPLITSSPFKSFPLFPHGDENAPWTYDSPSKVFSSNKFLSPSKYLPDTSKLSQQNSENWIVTGAMDNLDSEIDLSNLGTYEDSAALDLTQTFRSIGERPVGVEAYGPATLHQYS